MSESAPEKTEKTAKLSKILWLDLEMTGLSPETDVIIEAAAIVTDSELKELETYQNVVRQPQERLDAMNSWNQKCHRKSGLYPLIASGKSLISVEDDLINLAEQHFFKEEPALLAGNCIYQDRNFIKRYMPRLEKKLCYRMLDVTAWKLFFESKGVFFEKQNRHRALEDIKESVKEFQHYLSYIDSKKIDLKKTAEKI